MVVSLGAVMVVTAVCMGCWSAGRRGCPAVKEAAVADAHTQLHDAGILQHNHRCTAATSRQYSRAHTHRPVHEQRSSCTMRHFAVQWSAWNGWPCKIALVHHPTQLLHTGKPHQLHAGPTLMWLAFSSLRLWTPPWLPDCFKIRIPVLSSSAKMVPVISCRANLLHGQRSACKAQGLKQKCAPHLWLS